MTIMIYNDNIWSVERRQRRVEEDTNTAKWKENKISYIKKYNKRNYVNFSISFRREADKWIIDRIRSKPNKAAFMKKAIVDALEKDAGK